MQNNLQNLSDKEIITLILGGNDNAYSFIVARYKRRVFALASRFARGAEELEDICQEVFVKVYENLAKFRHESPFEHWLSKITIHTCHDTLRRRYREKNHQSFDHQLYALKDHAEEGRNRAREARELLEWAMSRLKPDERVVITLMELEEHTVKETAELTGWSEINVRVRSHRARQALKKVLEENDAL